MASSQRRMNILIYSGPGTTPTSIRHATSTLRHLLGPTYAIITLTSTQLLNEPWPSTCALLVFPGGADLAYCRVLNGDGNRKIRRYVEGGGAYLGLCAGGYYGCKRCEFEVGKKGMEVVGERELAFYPGVCRGLAFAGFGYGSERGAKAVEVVPRDGQLGRFKSYYNGGGVFVDAGTFEDRGVEVLATFGEELDVDGGEEGAAVVFCNFGEGRVVLTGPHPEFAPVNLNRENKDNPKYPEIIDSLTVTNDARIAFLKACLVKLGLEVTQESTPVPSLSRLHLSSIQPTQTAKLMQSLHENGVITKSEDGEECIKGENETFLLEQMGRWNMQSLTNVVKDAVPQAVKDALPSALAPTSSTSGKENQSPSADSTSLDRVPDYKAIPKRLVPHENAPPDAKETPYFNHAAFFSNLKIFRRQQKEEGVGAWGNTLLYGEVVTSTNTMLEKNPTLLNHLPTGFTATATTQISGRGRGSNVWVSPHGSLMFSTVLRHSLQLSNSAPVVFVQYIAALAIVQAIKTYDKGYDKLPVKLKWPNDIYALDPSSKESYVKIGGILVTSSYAGGDYTMVVGIGLNVNNSKPTVSLSQLAQNTGLPPLTLEKLLASVLVHFEELYTRFCRTGFDTRLEKMYYDCWLHTNQIVTLETEGGARARIKGITRDFGLLVAEELRHGGDVGTGKRWELQSDSNSFDFLRGLLKRKTL